MSRVKNLKAIIVLFIMITLLTISTIVTASTNEKGFSAEATLSSTSKLKAGDTVELTFSITSVNAGEGIDTITIDKITYDKDVFEEIKKEDFAFSNDWAMSMFAGEGATMSCAPSKITGPGTVFTLKLKVKETISSNSTTVTLSDVVASGGLETGDIMLGTKSVTINAEAPATSESSNNTTNTVNTTSSTNTKNTTKVVDNTVVKKASLPKTGIGQQIVIAVAVLAIVSIFCYVSYKGISRYIK